MKEDATQTCELMSYIIVLNECLFHSCTGWRGLSACALKNAILHSHHSSLTVTADIFRHGGLEQVIRDTTTDSAGIWPRLALTIEVALDSQVSHAEAEHREFVQTGANLLGKRQELRQPVQLAVQPIPVAFGRVWFNNIVTVRGLLSVE